MLPVVVQGAWILQPGLLQVSPRVVRHRLQPEEEGLGLGARRRGAAALAEERHQARGRVGAAHSADKEAAVCLCLRHAPRVQHRCDAVQASVCSTDMLMQYIYPRQILTADTGWYNEQ